MVIRAPRPFGANIEVQGVVIHADALETGRPRLGDEVHAVGFRQVGHVHIEGVSVRVLGVLRPADLGVVLWGAIGAVDLERLPPCGLKAGEGGVGAGRHPFMVRGRDGRPGERIPDLLTGHVEPKLRSLLLLFLQCRGGQSGIGSLGRDGEGAEHAASFRRDLLEVREDRAANDLADFGHVSPPSSVGRGRKARGPP